MANKKEMTVVNNKYRIKERDISDRIFHIAVLVLSILCFIVILYPLWFVVIASISNSDMVNRGEVVFWPKDIRFYGFQQIFQDARILTGYRKIGNSYYYLDPAKKGVVTKGFVMLNGKKYYFDSETGKQRRTPGWFFTGNYMYYILADGSIATNCTIGGYTIGPDGAVADAYGYDRKAQGYSSRTRYMILVDKSRHLVNFYQGSKGHWVNIRRNMPCTVGKKSTPTRSGNFMLSLKVTKNGKYGRKDFKASTAFYAFRINSGNFFHSILYKLGCTNPYTSKPKDAALGKNKSNSCIRLRLEDAKFIWDNMTRYTRTVVY